MYAIDINGKIGEAKVVKLNNSLDLPVQETESLKTDDYEKLLSDLDGRIIATKSACKSWLGDCCYQQAAAQSESMEILTEAERLAQALFESQGESLAYPDMILIVISHLGKYSPLEQVVHYRSVSNFEDVKIARLAALEVLSTIERLRNAR